MAVGPQDTPRHAGQVVRRVLLRRSDPAPAPGGRVSVMSG